MNQPLETLERDLASLADLVPVTLTCDDVRRRVARRHQRRLVWRSAAAGVVVLGSGIAIWRTTNPDPALRAASAPTTPARQASFVAPTPAPLLMAPDDGWENNYFDERVSAAPQLVMVDARLGLAGGSFVVLDEQSSLDLRALDGQDVAGIDGRAKRLADGSVIITWRVGDKDLVARSRGMTFDQTVAAAKTVTITDGVVGSEPGAALTVLSAEESELFGHAVEYEWTSGDKELSITLAPATILDKPAPGDEVRHSVTVRGQAGLASLFEATAPPLDDGQAVAGHELKPGRARVRWVEGTWMWDASGAGYPNREALLADLEAVRLATSVPEWEATLATSVVTARQRAAAVRAILADIPLPSGINVASLSASAQAADRYQLVAKVTGTVWCRWAELWGQAVDNGNAAAAATASQAIASSNGWAALKEIAAQGGWTSVMDEYSKRLASGDATVLKEAESGLGCTELLAQAAPEPTPSTP